MKKKKKKVEHVTARKRKALGFHLFIFGSPQIGPNHNDF